MNKFCKNCKHFDGKLLCLRDADFHLVTGKIILKSIAYNAESERYPYQEYITDLCESLNKKFHTPCGTNGTYFSLT